MNKQILNLMCFTLAFICTFSYSIKVCAQNSDDHWKLEREQLDEVVEYSSARQDYLFEGQGTEESVVANQVNVTSDVFWSEVEPVGDSEVESLEDIMRPDDEAYEYLDVLYEGACMEGSPDGAACAAGCWEDYLECRESEADYIAECEKNIAKDRKDCEESEAQYIKECKEDANNIEDKEEREYALRECVDQEDDSAAYCDEVEQESRAYCREELTDSIEYCSEENAECSEGCDIDSIMECNDD